MGTDTPEQQMFREAVRSFCEREISRDYVRECDSERRAPVELFKAIADQGWLGINFPEEYGGGGGGSREVAILLEEVGNHFLDLAFWLFRSLTWGGFAIGQEGTEEQKRELLPKVASGEISICFALTEPSAGSDAASIRTRAVPDGDDYLISGEKVFISGFKVSDYVLVVAKIPNDGDDRHAGFTHFLVPTDAPGLDWTPLQMLGHWPLGTAQLVFDEVRVPKEAALGPIGGAWSAMSEHLMYERLCLSAARTGAAQAALDDAVEYAKTREQFGRPISKFQAVSHKLADMQVQVHLSRLLLNWYVDRFEAGTASRADAAMLKLFSCEAYKLVADLGLQVLGGYGYSMEYDLQRHYREARLGVIGAGTSEIQRNIIAKSLGL